MLCFISVYRLSINAVIMSSISSAIFYYSGVLSFSSDRVKMFSRLIFMIIVENNAVVGVEAFVCVCGI